MSQTRNNNSPDKYNEVDVLRAIKEAEAQGLLKLPADIALSQAAEIITTTTLRSGAAVKDMLESLAHDASETAKKKKEHKRLSELQRVLEQILAREQQRGPAIEQDRSGR